jgi:hypothetical protein
VAEKLTLQAQNFNVGVEYVFKLSAWIVNNADIRSDTLFKATKEASPIVAVIDKSGG